MADGCDEQSQGFANCQARGGGQHLGVQLEHSSLVRVTCANAFVTFNFESAAYSELS